MADLEINSAQNINYGGVTPTTGDVLLKGEEVGKSGSIAWILANYFSQINFRQAVLTIEFDGSNVVKLTFKNANGQNLAAGNDSWNYIWFSN